MKSIISKIFKDSKIKPSGKILDSFETEFGKTRNIEWFDDGNYFEAIFYKDKIEYIARFDLNGILITTKINRPLSQATQQVKNAAFEIGELMNLIEIHKNGQIFYEIIARDSDLIRHSLLLNEEGKLLEKKKL